MKDERGSYTVEASIVVPFIIIFLFGLILSFLYMSQKTFLLKTAQYGAQQGAEICLNGTRNFDNGAFEYSKKGIKREGLYFKMSGSKKEEIIRQQIQKELSKGIISPKNVDIDVKYDKGFIGNGMVYVTMAQNVKVPFSNIKALFDGKEYLTLKVEANASVCNPTRKIRDIDLLLECAQRSEQWFMDRFDDKSATGNN